MTVVFLNNGCRLTPRRYAKVGLYAYRNDVMDPQESFQQRIWHIVAAIPQGKVATYGDIARLAGSPRAARQVGGVLRRLPQGTQLPWHRVINRHGAISLQGDDLLRQRDALAAEGIEISDDGRIALEQYRWRP